MVRGSSLARFGAAAVRANRPVGGASTRSVPAGHNTPLTGPASGPDAPTTVRVEGAGSVSGGYQHEPELAREWAEEDRDWDVLVDSPEWLYAQADSQ